MTFLSHLNWGDMAVNAGIVIDVLAVIGYGLQHDWPKVMYWVSATGIMVSLRLM